MTLKTGDILEFIGDEVEPKTHTMEVRGVLDSIIFVRNVFEVGVGSTTSIELETLITYGWKLKTN